MTWVFKALILSLLPTVEERIALNVLWRDSLQVSTRSLWRITFEREGRCTADHRKSPHNCIKPMKNDRHRQIVHI